MGASVEDVEASASRGEVQGVGVWEVVRGARVWSVASTLVGLSLWAQLFWVGLMSEVQFDAPRNWALLAYGLPVLVLAVGVLTRTPVVLLVLWVGSFLPGLVLLPEPERELLMEAGSMLRVGVSMALFLAVASAGSGADEEGEDAPSEALPAQTLSARGEMRWFVFARLMVLGVLFVVPAYAVYQDVEVAAALSRSYGSGAQSARVFLGVVHFFVWSVAAYMMVLVPALNVEYDRRRLGRELRELREGLTWRAAGVRVGLWFALSAALVSAVLAMK